MQSIINRLGIIGTFLLTGSLLFASFAVASIIAGSSTITVSNDVAYTLVTLNKPSDAVSGDVLLASIAVNGGSPAGIMAPNGWTRVARTDNDTNISIASYWKAVGSSEPASYTWTISPQTRAAGGLTRYVGVDTINPIDITGSSTGRGTVAVAPSITTSHDNERVIVVFATNAGTNNVPLFSTTAGMTKKYDVKNTPFGPTAAAEDIAQAVAGASGSASSTISNNSLQRDWAAQTIALRFQPTLHTDLVSYWRFDGPSGNATDSAGLNTLTNVNGATYSNDAQIGDSATLASSSKQYFEITNAAQTGLNLGKNFSISMWVKLATEPAPYSDVDDGWYVLAQKDGGDVEHGRQYELYYLFDGSQYRLALYTFNQTSPGAYDLAYKYVTYDLGTTTWHHIVATWDGSLAGGAENKVQIYVDGNDISSYRVRDDGVTTPDSGSEPFRVGGDNLDPNRYHLNGKIDEMGVWNRTLYPSEVSQLFNDGSAGISYPF